MVLGVVLLSPAPPPLHPSRPHVPLPRHVPHSQFPSPSPPPPSSMPPSRQYFPERGKIVCGSPGQTASASIETFLLSLGAEHLSIFTEEEPYAKLHVNVSYFSSVQCRRAAGRLGGDAHAPCSDPAGGEAASKEFEPTLPGSPQRRCPDRIVTC